MKATTIRLDGDLLSEIESTKPEGQSVTAYVRDVLQKEVRRQRARNAAAQYHEFLAQNIDERQWMDEWAAAGLVTPPRLDAAERL